MPLDGRASTLSHPIEEAPITCGDDARFAPTRRAALAGAGALLLSSCAREATPGRELLNVSYDPTREFYEAYNRLFAERLAQEKRGDVRIKQSHGGSGRQARAVIDGLKADVVTLALPLDIDAIAERGLIARDWRSRLPNGAAPYTSTIVFLVRAGDPKTIRDWNDLSRLDVSLVVANPKTSGAARLAYLALWRDARNRGGSDAEAEKIVAAALARVPVLDIGARGATTSFAQRGVGDVLLTWENEAHLATREFPDARFEIVTPPRSILAEPPVAVVDAVVDAKGTRDVATAYLEGLYAPEAQRLAAENGYRPRDASALAGNDRFQPVELFTVEEAFESWAAAQAAHFADGGSFDRIMAGRKS